MEPQAFHDYPMGPTIRRFVGISEQDYRGFENSQPSEDQATAFREYLSQLIMKKRVSSFHQLRSFSDDLLKMGEGRLIRELVSANPQYEGEIGADFSTLAALGTANILEEEYGDAERLFRKAQALDPSEIGPYVNLSEMFYHQARDPEALQWALAGLDIDRNHFRLWHLVADLHQKWNLGEEARKRNSWVGQSIAVELTHPDDSIYKLAVLERLYLGGERDPSFLVEYTALLGEAGRYDKIPLVVWQEERLGQKLPWQLWVHAAQAYLALDQLAQFQDMVRKAFRDQDLPARVMQELQTLHSESGAPTKLCFVGKGHSNSQGDIHDQEKGPH